MDFSTFIGGDYRSQGFTVDREMTMNWYVERMERQGPTTRKALYPTPGVEVISAAPNTGGKANFEEAGRQFIVVGEYFGEVDANGAHTFRGVVASDQYPATISSNGAGQLFITAGGNGYLFDLTTNVFSTIAALASKARMGAMLDGYFLALNSITSSTVPRVLISDLLDGATWDPTRFIERSAAPDPWVAMYVSSTYVYFLGEQTGEVWYDAGSSPIPFALHPSGRIAYGIAGAFSGSVIDGTLYWLSKTAGGTGAVVRASGFGPEVISTYPIQLAIGLMTTISDATGDSYTEAGHSFYLLHFTAEEQTWCYDVQGRDWHRRGTWISESNKYIAWRPRWHAFAFGEHRWLDAETGSLYRSSIEIFTDVDDREIRRERVSPSLVQELERVFYNAFELDLDVGVGLVSGQGEDPQVMLQYSDDGGLNWSDELWRSAGKIGEYSTRVRWDRLGQARRRLFRVVVTDPIPWRITGAYLDVGQTPRSVQQRQSA